MSLLHHGTVMAEDDFSQLSLDDRISHKSWKARLSAYKDLENIFKNDESTPTVLEHLKKACGDPHAAAQETGLNAVLCYISLNKTKTASVIVPILIEKAFNSTRSGTKSVLLDILLMFLETGDAVIEPVIPAISHKNPKVIVTALQFLATAIRDFGTGVVQYKLVFKELKGVFEHRDKGVREAGVGVVVEVYKHVGEQGVAGFVGGLKSVQEREVREAFEGVDSGAIVRWVRGSEPAGGECWFYV